MTADNQAELRDTIRLRIPSETEIEVQRSQLEGDVASSNRIGREILPEEADRLLPHERVAMENGARIFTTDSDTRLIVNPVPRQQQG